MELRNRTTGAVITDRDLRRMNPTVSFPEVLTADIADSFGYDIVLEGKQPTPVTQYDTIVRSGVEKIDSQWFTKYILGPVFTDNDYQTAAEQRAIYRKSVDDEQARRIRSTRDTMLSGSDWTQFHDSPVDKAAWGAYRQALRNVPLQSGFPWSVDWPTKPSAVRVPDYNGFWDGLLISPAYQSIRSQALTNPAVLIACTEFIAAISDAKLGRPNVNAIQACISLLMQAADLSDEDLSELDDLLVAANLDDVYALQ